MWKKSFEDFRNNHTDCKICNSNRNLKRHYESKDKLSNQKNYITKKIDKIEKNKIIDI